MKPKRRRPGRGGMPEYPRTAKDRWREIKRKRFQDVQDVQDVLTGFNRIEKELGGGYGKNKVTIQYNGQEYVVLTQYDSDYEPWEGTYSIVRREDIRETVSRGDVSDNPSRDSRGKDVILLDEDCRLLPQYEWYKKNKIGKAAAWDQAVRCRNSIMRWCRNVQQEQVSYYGVTVQDSEGNEESLWGVDEESIVEAVRDLLYELN